MGEPHNERAVAMAVGVSGGAFSSTPQASVYNRAAATKALTASATTARVTPQGPGVGGDREAVPSREGGGVEGAARRTLKVHRLLSLVGPDGWAASPGGEDVDHAGVRLQLGDVAAHCRGDPDAGRVGLTGTGLTPELGQTLPGTHYCTPAPPSASPRKR